MNRNRNMTAMGFTRETFPAGTHMCLIYSHEEARRKVIGKFLESGIIAGEKVSYFADMMKPEEVREWLSNMNIELPDDARFSVLVAEKTYCPGGEFVPDDMLNTLRLFYDQAKQEEYPDARISGEMSWALRGIPGSERLMEYEALVNDVLVTHPVTAMCQYDANKFSGATILDVLKVHPMMVVHGQIVHNPYYMKPEDFLKDYRAQHESAH
ncbi:MAG: MEDS domain-containing protein [Desulfuromonadales bacterium]